MKKTVMSAVYRLTAVLCALCLMCAPAFAEEETDWEEEISLEDTAGIIIEEEILYDDVAWDFPVDLNAMDPIYVMLANKEMKLASSFVPDPLVTVKTQANGGVNKASGSQMQLEKTCYEALVTMFGAAQEDGIKLYLKSAYRSWQTQNTMYYNRLQKNNGKDDGWVSQPGASDHQTGLGCDIVSRSWRDKALNAKFADTAEARWMAEHCAAYGFILRYPEDKTGITEINFEPWHMRYVGVAAATYIMDNGLCLEEFCEQLRAACGAFIAAGGSPTLVEPFMQVSAE